MNAFLKVYAKKNLGDDLFIWLLLNRYKNVDFYSYSDACYLNLPNFNYKKSKENKLHKLCKIFTVGLYKYKDKNFSSIDTSILLGGSMFIEKKRIIRSCISMLTNNYSYEYYIGTNFGPFYSKMFLNHYKSKFKKALDICFRDMYSYNLFRELANTRYAPDIVFSLDYKKYIVNCKKNIAVISIIDVSKKISKDLKNNYEKIILECISSLVEREFEVILMSFCKDEGDEEAIHDILNNSDFGKNISTFFYDGNINEALKILGAAKIIIGSRFHANILGLTMNKHVIPMAYSDKMINVLSDLNYSGEVIDIRRKENININKIIDFSLNYRFNVDCQRKLALNHFEKLDILFDKFKNN